MSGLIDAFRPLQFSDFSGGITDNYVEAPMNKYERADNLLILPNRKLKTRPGSELLFPSYPQTPSGNERISTLINYDHDSLLLQVVEKDIFYVGNAGWVHLLGPSSNPVFNAGSLTSLVAQAQWNRHLIVTNDSFATPQKIYRDGSGALRVRTAGLPRMASDPTITPSTPGANSYLYVFLYRYDYTVDTVSFSTFGPTREMAVLSSSDPGTHQNNITAIPVLANGGTQNYDTANIQVEVYRTSNNGITLYKVGELTNGTTTFTDNVSDAAIVLNQPLYTSGGRVDNDPPPAAKFVHSVNGIFYYAHIQEGGETIPNRVRQSIADIPDAVPGSFFVDVEEEIVGISSVRGSPVVLCKKAIYRLDGTFDEQGQGSINYQKINDTAGCVSHKSIVQTVDGIFWAGNDGFYFSDGYRVQKISNGFNITYATLVSTATQRKNITGAYEDQERRVWWAVQADSSSLDNDSCYVLDLRWGLSEESTFTTVSGGGVFAPTAITFFNKEFVRADKHGYVLRHNDTLYSDPRIDPLALTTDWNSQTIIWDWISNATNFGDSKNRKWVPRMITSFKNESNISVQIISNNDDSRQVKDLTPIRYRDNPVWRAVDPTWGDVNLFWNTEGLIENTRRFPAGTLRCMYKQVELTNGYVVVTNSDTIGTATTTAVAGTNTVTVTLDDVVNFYWPADSVDYDIYFEADAYTQAYQVTAVGGTNGTVLTVLDPNARAPMGAGQKWVLKGKPKNEVLNLLSVTLLWAPTSPSQQQATTTAALDGANT